MIMLKNLQHEVWAWCVKCFGEKITEDKIERNYRFLEEALELVQACGASKEDALKLVDYVYSRPVGESYQEVGGVMITLCALCNAHGIALDLAAKDELLRIHQNIDKIRKKQAQKKIVSGPLP